MTPSFAVPFQRAMSRTVATAARQRALSFEAAYRLVAAALRRAKRSGGKVILVGNGGSATIASHCAVDIVKSVGMQALTFNDAGLLTCMANDYGYGRVFAEPLAVAAASGDILWAISSSGRSASILNAAACARAKGCFVVTLSGFDPGNPLRTAGDVNFYVPSHAYGCVEIAHLAISHTIFDRIAGIAYDG